MYVEAKKTVETLKQGKASDNKSGYLIRIALTAALAGFIFGFDTVVISGANGHLFCCNLMLRMIR